MHTPQTVSLRHSLKARIILATLAVFLTSLWSLSFFASQMLRKDMERLLGEQQSATVSMVATLVNHELEERLRALETAAELCASAMRKGRPALQAFLEQRQDLHALFNLGTFVTGMDGVGIADFPLTQGRIGINFSERDYIETPIKTGKSAIGRPIIGKVIGAPVLVITTPLRDADGQTLGVLAGATSLGIPNFFDQITNSHYGKTGGYLLIAPSFRLIVTASDKRRIMEELPAPGVNPSLDDLIAGKAWSAAVVTLSGIESLASSGSVPLPGWQAVALLPTDEAFAPIRDMQQRMLFATLFLTLLAGSTSWWMLRHQLSPLTNTAKTLAAMSNANQPPQALDIVRQDEIGQLIGGFNRLLETLGEREAALRESEERFKALHDASFGGIAIHDQGVILDCNLGLAELSGYSAAELIGMNGLELIAPECRKQVIENIQKGLDQPYDAEGIRKDGVRRQYNVRGKNIPYKGRSVRVTEFSDITERKQAEAKLVESEARLQTLIHAIPDLIWLKNPDGVYLACNQRFENFFGLSEKEIVNKTDYDFVDKELADSFREHDRISMTKGAPSVNEEWITFANDNHRELLETTKTPVFDTSGRLLGVLGIGHDITERKRLESEMVTRVEELDALNKRLEEAQNQLVQSEKMSAVGQLAAGVAHEINNPIGFVSSNLGSLKEYVRDMMRLIDAYQLVANACPPEHPAVLRANALRTETDIDFLLGDVMSLLSESQDGLERVKRIVADLKDFSRVGESQWQPADVHHCLDSTLNVVANEIKYKADVVKEYGTLPRIRCMPFQLNQVFMNLIVNASHAIKDHGTITLRTGCGTGTVWIEIKDDGEGIPPENFARIFEPFFTTKPIGSGTGLGLSVSYGIVKKHHGRIEVCSEPGKGTVFRVTLPIDPQPEDNGTNTAA